MSSVLSRECERLREWLPEYAEGMAKDRRRARIERHLASCKGCAQEVSDLRVVTQAVRKAPADPLPDGVIPGIRQAVAQRAARRPSSALHWRTAAVAAGLAVAAMALGVTGRMFSRQRGTGAAPLMGKASQEQVAQRAEAPATPTEPVRRKEPAQIAETPPTPEADEQRPAAEANVPAAPAALSQAPAGQPPTFRQPLAKPRRGPVEGAPPRVGPRVGPRRWVPTRSRDWAMYGGRGGGGFGGDRAQGGIPPGQRVSAERGAPAEATAGPVELTRLGAAKPDADLGLAGVRAKAAAPSPHLSVRVAVATQKEAPSIILDLSADPGVGRVAVYADRPTGRQLLWQGEPLGVRTGEPTRATAIALAARQTGPGPAAVPITVESQAGSAKYVLFVPTLATLGQTCAASPVARYRGEPLAQVLADLSALTGMVLLAEGPLNRPVEGELPAGTPAEALAQIAGRAGLQVHGEGDLARTLTYPR